MDKSKENTRIAALLAMTAAARNVKIAMGIKNPQIYKNFVEAETFDWDYAVAANLLTKEDAKWIKEHVN